VAVPDEAEIKFRAQLDALRRPRVDRKIIGIVIHGMGEQAVGFTLKQMINEFLRLVRRRIDCQASVSVKPVDEGDPAEGYIWFQDPATRDVYELRFLEVWFAKAFEPISLGSFIGGLVGFAKPAYEQRGTKEWSWWGIAWLIGFALVRLLCRLIAVVFFIIAPFALILMPIARRTGLAPIFIWIARRTLLARILNWIVRRAGLTRRPGTTAVDWWLERLRQGQAAIVDVALIPLAPFLLAALIAFWLLEPLRSAGVLPSPIAQLQRTLTNIPLQSLGDVWIYFKHPWDASRIRVRFEERFRQIMEIVRLDQENENKIEAVVVMAHSLGSVVAYEALTGRRILKLIHEIIHPGGRVRFHFITFGSALNSAWDFVTQEERFRFFNRLIDPAIRWLNIYSQEDPVSRWPLRRPRQPRGILGRLGQPQSFRNLEVVNQMDMFSDHSAYWNNAEQVLAPMLNRITGGRLMTRLRMRSRARTWRVTGLAFFKALAWIVGLAVFAILMFLEVGDWGVDQIRNYLPDEKNWWQQLIYLLLSAVLVAAVAAALAAVVYSTIVKWIWDLIDRGAKYRYP
jgi:hypothetical protein